MNPLRFSATRRELLTLFGAGMLVSLQTGCSPVSTPPVEEPGEPGALHYLSLAEVARLIETKKISPVELTQLMLARIRSLDGRLHSYATVMADSALAAAPTRLDSAPSRDRVNVMRPEAYG